MITSRKSCLFNIMIQINLQIFFQTQQSWGEDLTGVLWLKKLLVNKNRNWSAMDTEQEENIGECILALGIQV